MDNKNQYIDMCAKASELQNFRFRVQNDKGYLVEFPGFEDGDYFSTKNGVEIIGTTVYPPTFDPKEKRYSISRVGYDEGDGYDSDSVIWLPRQDQLQEMIKKESGHLPVQRLIGLELCNLYAWYQQSRPNDIAEEFTSFEQLWLAFVMKKNYNKIWSQDKEVWIKAEEEFIG